MFILLDSLNFFYQNNLERATPAAPPGDAAGPGELNYSARYDISSAETRVLVANHLTTVPAEGGTHYHWRKGSKPPSLLCHQGRREPAYLYGSFSSGNSRCPPPYGVLSE
ncbi:hypothetical protein AVEN_214060-1 [Araneus ventricosus]|uniref:Uncharacterized protein n=1 Tax=Araneus ventricosus TaxID=182803 RepID=A0A4Y2QYR0_ARAVE|nr:hypothetical protein AVEN_214060-1 [Araneus ventricosus]